VLFTLADQPFISNIHLNTIMKLHLREQQAIIVTKKENYKGVPVLFPRNFFSELMQLSNNEGAKQVIINNKNHVKEVLTQDNTEDIDTYDTYLRCLKSIKKYKD
jgi:molybdenum cofactor cytidylyltransferase